MHQLIENLFYTHFENPWLATKHDGAVLELPKSRLAFTTDSYVVRPLFFPGGDIGKLAVFGTANDLAMCGARPLFLSVGLILEEGFPMAPLVQIVQSIRQAAEQARVHVVTGDTKVVDRGKGDGIFINTSGIGVLEYQQTIGPQQIQPGDAIILSGDVGRHGITVLAAREGLNFQTTLSSDCAPLADLVLALLESGIEIHCLRDLTRGGLASALVELVRTCQWTFHIRESAIAVDEQVRGACELLGLDPLHVACEGRFVAFVPAVDERRTLDILRSQPLSSGATTIGYVHPEKHGQVVLTSPLGTSRIMELPSGEQLPRIC